MFGVAAFEVFERARGDVESAWVEGGGEGTFCKICSGNLAECDFGASWFMSVLLS